MLHGLPTAARRLSPRYACQCCSSVAALDLVHRAYPGRSGVHSAVVGALNQPSLIISMQASIQMMAGPFQPTQQVWPAQVSSSRRSQRTHRRAATAPWHHSQLHTGQTLSTHQASSSLAHQLFPHGSNRVTCQTAAAVAAPGWDAFGPEEDELVVAADNNTLPRQAPPAAAQPAIQQLQQALPRIAPVQPPPRQMLLAQGHQQPWLLSPATRTHTATPASTPGQPGLLAPPGRDTLQLQRPSTDRQVHAPQKQHVHKWKKLRFQDHVQPNSNISIYDSMPVRVTVKSGAAAPAPISSFDRLHRLKFSKLLLRAMLAMRYHQPTPIQRHTIPAIAQGRDVCAVSPTGSGKTAAYLVPVLATLLRRCRDGGPMNTAYPMAVILAPTRELVAQIYEIASRLVRGSHIKTVQLHGGENIVTQVKALRGGCDLIVATPGRLLDMVAKKSVHLGRVFMTVVDEADKMMDLGWEHELRRLMTHPQLAGSTERQTLMFSTRLGANLEQVAAQYLRSDYIHVAVGHESGAAPLVTHRVLATSDADKLQHLKQLLSLEDSSADGQLASMMQPAGSSMQHAGLGDLTIVFTNTMAAANQVHQAVVSQLGVSAGLLHSGLAQTARDEAMDCFRHGLTPVLVSTMLSARGVDVPDAGQVINWDVPTTVPEYVQRCGRTGRGGRTGIATTFVTPKDARHAHVLVEVMQAVQQQPPDWLMHMAARQQQVQQRSPHSRDRDPQQQQPARTGAARAGRYVGQAAAAIAAQKQALAFPWTDLLQPSTPPTAATADGPRRYTHKQAPQQDRSGHAGAADSSAQTCDGSSSEARLPADHELLQQWYAAVAVQRPHLGSARARWAAAASGKQSQLAALVPPLPLPPSVVQKYKQREEEEQQQQQEEELHAAAVAAASSHATATRVHKPFSRRRHDTPSDVEPSRGQQQEQGPKISARGARWAAAFQ